uniref:Uncharacterized protein n=1 Tax=Haptolina brevifila TaxID=156173 RepID=A0A7S2GLX2_9EUKA
MLEARKDQHLVSRLAAAIAIADSNPDETHTPNGNPKPSEAPWGFPVAIFGAIHDGLTPPNATLSIHAAWGHRRSQLVWFPTGHWPNLAREAGAQFHTAAADFLRSAHLPPALLTESTSLQQTIEAWDAPSPPSMQGLSCILL